MNPMPAAAASAWKPLLEGEDSERAFAAVRAVAEAIGEGELAGVASGPSLAGGEAGVALLFEMMDRAGLGEHYGELALLRMERAIDGVAAAPLDPSLYSGFTGVGWTAEILTGGSPDGEGDGDVNAAVDEALAAHLRASPWTGPFDLIAGLVGYGVYALSRLPRPAAVAALERIVGLLAESAASRPGGLCWHTSLEMHPEPNRPYFPYGNDNLGVAHGTPGVVGFLAQAVAAGVAVEPALGLLRGAVPWLLAQKIEGDERSVYPYSVGREVPVRPARAAWCFGDPGIAAVLLAAGRAAGVPEWEREAVATARAAALRPAELCQVNDGSLCHGSAGLGHLFNRLYRATGDPDAGTAARAWFRRALAAWKPGEGVGGFLAFLPLADDPETLTWQEDPGFLNGSAGIALALLAAVSDAEPVWDRALLLSPLACGPR